MFGAVRMEISFLFSISSIIGLHVLIIIIITTHLHILYVQIIQHFFERNFRHRRIIHIVSVHWNLFACITENVNILAKLWILFQILQKLIVVTVNERQISILPLFIMHT